MKKDIILISAIADNNIIGLNGKIPWHTDKEMEIARKADMTHFKALTMGNPVIIGRKTFDKSIPSKFKPLKGRLNIILTQNYRWESEGVTIARDMIEAISIAQGYGDRIYVAGGQKVYGQTIDIADFLEITEIHKEYTGDAFFPEIKRGIWQELQRQDFHDLRYSFVTYKRIKSP